MTRPIKVLSLASYKFLPPKMGGEKGIAFFNKYLSKKLSLICVTVKVNLPEYAPDYEIENIISNNRLRYINFFNFFKNKKNYQKK